MSYDLMVFKPNSAPRTRLEFMAWFDNQAKWAEGHSYNDPAVTCDELRNWFMEMIKTFPALNGPYAVGDPDNEFSTDYSIGKEVIYAAFPWSAAEKAYPIMKKLAEEHRVGFYDVSATDGDILFPDNNGRNLSIDRPGNLSSIQQIKSWAMPGEENKSVQEILFRKLNLQATIDAMDANNTVEKATLSWWQKLFGFK
jgi:hypothetical protein